MSAYFILKYHKNVNIDLLSYKIGYLIGQGLNIDEVRAYIDRPKIPLGGCPTRIDKELDRYVNEVKGLDEDDDDE